VNVCLSSLGSHHPEAGEAAHAPDVELGFADVGDRKHDL
jgi:hypothetical protein